MRVSEALTRNQAHRPLFREKRYPRLQDGSRARLAPNTHLSTHRAHALPEIGEPVVPRGRSQGGRLLGNEPDPVVGQTEDNPATIVGDLEANARRLSVFADVVEAFTQETDEEQWLGRQITM